MRCLLFLFCLLSFVACSDDTPEDPMTNDDFEIWTGTNTTFTKESGADPSLEANQDRISDNVWITRGNEGGQIYNIKSEDLASKSSSPAKTKWAVGTVSEIGNLTFSNFRAAVGNPKEVVGKKLILHLEEDDVYIPLEFTSWEQEKGGGFAYTRATK